MATHGTTTLEHNRAMANHNSLQALQNSNENKNEEEGFTQHDPSSAQQDSGQMMGEEKKKNREQKQRAERKICQRKCNARNCSRIRWLDANSKAYKKNEATEPSELPD